MFFLYLSPTNSQHLSLLQNSMSDLYLPTIIDRAKVDSGSAPAESEMPYLYWVSGYSCRIKSVQVYMGNITSGFFLSRII